MIVLGGLESETNTGEAREGPQQQPGANQQHDGQRHLRHHQRAAEPVMTPVRGAAARSLAERDACGSTRLACHAGMRPNAMAVSAETPTVKRRHVPSTRIGSVAPMASAPPVSENSASRGPPGHREPRGPAERREHQALDDELPDQPEPGRAERSAERELRAPPEAARHQQAREVHAGNDEHHRDDGHQESKRGPSFHDQVVVQRGDEHAVAFVERILPRELRGDDCHLRPRRIDRDAWLQSSVALERTRPDRPGLAGSIASGTYMSGSISPSRSPGGATPMTVR